jgi:hypothetical protein
MKIWALASMALSVGVACSSGSTPTHDGGGMFHDDAGHGNEASTDGPAPVDSGAAVAAACMSYAMAWCDQLNSCNTVGILMDYGAAAVCQDQVGAECINELSAPMTGESPADRMACVSAIPGWGCSDFLNNQNAPAACAPKSGGVASGGGCGFSSQCSTGFCSVAHKAQCGKCASLPVAGDKCAKTQDCGPTGDLVCAGNVCYAPGAVGAPCTPPALDMPCLFPLSCTGYMMKTKTPGTCQLPVQSAGSTCSPGALKNPDCDLSMGLVCDGSGKPPHTCVAVSLAATGAACGTSTGQRVFCSNGANCSAPPGPGSNGTCIPAIPDKGSCELMMPKGAQCLSPARCIAPAKSKSGTCEFDNASGC